MQVEELTFFSFSFLFFFLADFIRYMLFLRIRPCSRSPFGAWNFHTSSKNVINENKPLLQNSRVLHLEIANVHDGTSRSSRCRAPCCLESMCTEKDQARSFMTSTHASVRCSILVFTDIRHLTIFFFFFFRFVSVV